MLGDVGVIFAESVERTQKLLSHYDIKKKYIHLIKIMKKEK